MRQVFLASSSQKTTDFWSTTINFFKFSAAFVCLFCIFFLVFPPNLRRAFWELPKFLQTTFLDFFMDFSNLVSRILRVIFLKVDKIYPSDISWSLLQNSSKFSGGLRPPILRIFCSKIASRRADPVERMAYADRDFLGLEREGPKFSGGLRPPMFTVFCS